MKKKKLRNKTLVNKGDYRVLIEIYYLNKAEVKKEARLPINDFRRQVVREKTEHLTQYISPIKKALVRIAALW